MQTSAPVRPLTLTPAPVYPAVKAPKAFEVTEVSAPRSIATDFPIQVGTGRRVVDADAGAVFFVFFEGLPQGLAPRGFKKWVIFSGNLAKYSKRRGKIKFWGDESSSWSGGTN